MTAHRITADAETFIEPTVQLKNVATSPVDTIMVKFTVNKQSMVPTRIKERIRGCDEQSDVRQQFAALKAGNAELAEVGRVREGRVDTGEQRIAIQNVGTNVDFLRRDLTKSGFRLTMVQYYTKKGNGKYDNTKYVVECIFSRIGEGDEPFDSAPYQNALRELATTTFNFCYVWVNPNMTCTINLAGRAPDQEADGSLKVVDGELQYVKN